MVGLTGSVQPVAATFPTRSGAHGTARIWKGKAEDRKPQAQETLGKMEEPQVEKEKEMSEIIILASLVLIVGLLGFIALMIFIIGHNLDRKD